MQVLSTCKRFSGYTSWIPHIDPLERFWAKVDRRGPDECWPWLASIFARGYGQFTCDGKVCYAHVWIYERLHGPRPAGWEVDHMCHNWAADRDECDGPQSDCLHRRCVNPAHLEAVPHRVNSQRGRTGKHNLVKTHCPKGHPYSGDNLIIETSGSRRCRICRDANMQRFLERQGRPRRVLVTYRGEARSIAGWARETGMSPSVLAYRLRKGWPLDDVFDPTNRRKVTVR